MLEKADSEFVMHGCCPPPVPRLVSLQQAATRSACKCDGHELRFPKYLLDTLPG